MERREQWPVVQGNHFLFTLSLQADYVSDLLVCSIIAGVITQIKEAMKQTLVKFISVKAPAKSRKTKSVKKNLDPSGETASGSSLIDGLTASSTNGVITEIIRLCCPEISHKMRQGKTPDQPVSFQQVLNSIVKAIDNAQVLPRAPRWEKATTRTARFLMGLRRAFSASRFGTRQCTL